MKSLLLIPLLFSPLQAPNPSVQYFDARAKIDTSRTGYFDYARYFEGDGLNHWSYIDDTITLPNIYDYKTGNYQPAQVSITLEYNPDNLLLSFWVQFNSVNTFVDNNREVRHLYYWVNWTLSNRSGLSSTALHVAYMQPENQNSVILFETPYGGYLNRFRLKAPFSGTLYYDVYTNIPIITDLPDNAYIYDGSKPETGGGSISGSGGLIDVLTSPFEVIASLFDKQILPGFSLGMLIILPLAFLLIYKLMGLLSK